MDSQPDGHSRKRKVRDSNPGSCYTFWFSRPVHSSTLPTFLVHFPRSNAYLECSSSTDSDPESNGREVYGRYWIRTSGGLLTLTSLANSRNRPLCQSSKVSRVSVSWWFPIICYPLLTGHLFRSDYPHSNTSNVVRRPNPKAG